MRLAESIVIPAPPELVWPAIAEPAGHLNWRPDLIEFRQLTDGPFGVGTHLRERVYRSWHLESIDYLVTEFEPERKLCLRSLAWTHGDLELEYELGRQGRTTVAVLRVAFVPRGRLGRLASPILARILRRALRAQADGLQRHVTSGLPSRSD